jgi:hypothetical protein
VTEGGLHRRESVRRTDDRDEATHAEHDPDLPRHRHDG